MRKNENGRSMVEMLGVLAIIGVLSVAGIAGYTVAMRKYRANEIAQAISTTVILAKSAHGGTGTVAANSTYASLSGADNPSGLTSIAVNPAAGGTYNNTLTVTMANADNDLCLAVQAILGTTNTNPIYVSTACANGVMTVTSN